MPRYETAITSYLLALALLPAALTGCRKTEGNAPAKSTETNDSAAQAEPADPAPSKPRIPIQSANPFKRYAKFTGTLGDNVPLTVYMTQYDLGHGLSGHGRFHYAGSTTRQFTTDFFDTTRFEFKRYGTVGDSAIFTGRYDTFDIFQGHCTLFKVDSTYDSLTYAWTRKTTRESHPFRIAKTDSGSVPVEFEIHYRQNDSGSEARKLLKNPEYYYDTLPSSLRIILAKVRSNYSEADAAINKAILETMAAFQESRDGSKHTASIESMMAEFDSEWAYFKGAYFGIDYYCDIETNENAVLSIRYSENSYAGGAHGTTRHILRSYDVATGREIHLSDILIENFHTALGGLANIPNCDGDPENEYPCSIQNLLKGGFSIGHDGLDFIRDHIGHEMPVHIPYSDLKPIIDKAGILARFVP